MKLKYKTNEKIVLMHKMSYLILEGLNKAWGYFKQTCFLPLYFIFQVYGNIMARWCGLTKIILRALLNEIHISKAAINALDFLEWDGVHHIT